MENIEVGEWVRSKIGSIGKVTKIEDGKFLYEDKSLITFIDNVVKHSKNIIDLIEVGDVIEYQVNSLSELKVGRVKKYRDARNSKEYLGVEGFDITKIYIKSILTHEQYKQNCYKVSNDKTQ